MIAPPLPSLMSIEKVENATRLQLYNTHSLTPPPLISNNTFLFYKGVVCFSLCPTSIIWEGGSFWHSTPLAGSYCLQYGRSVVSHSPPPLIHRHCPRCVVLVSPTQPSLCQCPSHGHFVFRSPFRGFCVSLCPPRSTQ